MKRFSAIIVSLILICFVACPQSKSEEVLQNVITKFFNSGGVEANYTLSSNNNVCSGIIKLQKQNFAIINQLISTWYDGKTQWNYNYTSNEVTISEPSEEELELINPYNIVVNYKNKFTSALVGSKLGGTYCIVMKPVKTSSDIIKAVLYIKASDYNLVRADVTMSNNITSTFILTNIKCGLNLKKEEFVFPKNKYKTAKIIDLR